jgi:Plasmid pRiA4b ORF-3-like protein
VGDAHLHAFRITQKGTRGLITIQYPDLDGDFGFGDEPLDERKEYIAILFEKEVLFDSDTQYPLCVTGENACPPEDCGGVGGYENLQNILKNSKHPQYKDMLEWLDIKKGDRFDPTHFDPTEVYFRDPKKVLKEYKKGFGV